jgi:hypothetical protein
VNEREELLTELRRATERESKAFSSLPPLLHEPHRQTFIANAKTEIAEKPMQAKRWEIQ